LAYPTSSHDVFILVLNLFSYHDFVMVGRDGFEVLSSSNNFSPRSKSHNLYFDIPLWNKTGQLDHFLAKSMILLAYPYQIYIFHLHCPRSSRTNWQASEWS
jgi:hypothetical protein